MSDNNLYIEKRIFPLVFSMVLEQTENDKKLKLAPLSIDLPRDAYYIYLKKVFNDSIVKEMDLLKKYSCGINLQDSDFDTLLSLVMKKTSRNTAQKRDNMLAQFGIKIEKKEDKLAISLIDEAVDKIRAETWEYIIIDILNKSAMEVISCFDFEGSFKRESKSGEKTEELHYYLGAWKFSDDLSEQNLNNTLRNAFMFTLASYYWGERKDRYNSFIDYFESEFYKRVSLIYGMWSSMDDNSKIKYIPLYDSFTNLSSTNKSELIDVLKAILDSESIPLDEKQTLKEQLIEGAGEFHHNISATDIALEQSLIKPAINLVLLREKAKETIASAETLFENKKYVDCANRCYYSMMFTLKALLEHQGLLADWKVNELKEKESHDSLEKGLNDLVSRGILDVSDQTDFEYVKDQRWKCDYSLYYFNRNDAEYCINIIKKFFAKVEAIMN